MKKFLPLAVTAAAVAYYAYTKLVEASNNSPKNNPSVSSVDFNNHEDGPIVEKTIVNPIETNIDSITSEPILSEEVIAEKEEVNDTNLIDDIAIEPETVVQPVTLNAIDVAPVIEEDTKEPEQESELYTAVENVEETDNIVNLEQFTIEPTVESEDDFDPDPIIETDVNPIIIDDGYTPKSEAEAFINSFVPEMSSFKTKQKEKLTVSVAKDEEINQQEVEELIEKIRPVEIVAEPIVEPTDEKIEEIVSAVEEKVEESIVEVTENVEAINQEEYVSSFEPEIVFDQAEEKIEEAIVEAIETVKEINQEEYVSSFEPEIVFDQTEEKIEESHSSTEEIVKELEKIDAEESQQETTKLQFDEQDEIEEIVVEPKIKQQLLANPDQQRKILELQIDLQMADFDEGTFIVSQKIVYKDGDLFNSLVNDIRNYDYYVEQNDNGALFINRKITGKDKVKPCVLALFDRVKEDNQIYENFKVKAVK